MPKDDEIVKELKQIKTLLAMNLIKDLETKTEKILYLGKSGVDTSEIAKIIGTTPGTVSVAISQAKKKSKK